MRALLFLIAFSQSFLTCQVSGQNENSKKFEISMIPGLSLPIASYGRKNPEKSAIYIIQASLPSVKGFDKGRSGFAKIGYDYNIELSYSLSSSLKLLLRTGTFSNPVETNSMSDFLTHLNGDRETRVDERDYTYFYATPGFGYRYVLRNFDLGFDIFAGYSMTKYPYYKFVLLFTTVDPPIIFAHLGPKPTLHGFTYGSQVSADYNISDHVIIGFNLAFQSANFKYKVQPSSYPGGGSTNFDYHDILKTRILNIGVKLGVKI